MNKTLRTKVIHFGENRETNQAWQQDRTLLYTYEAISQQYSPVGQGCGSEFARTSHARATRQRAMARTTLKWAAMVGDGVCEENRAGETCRVRKEGKGRRKEAAGERKARAVMQPYPFGDAIMCPGRCLPFNARGGGGAGAVCLTGPAVSKRVRAAALGKGQTRVLGKKVHLLHARRQTLKKTKAGEPGWALSTTFLSTLSSWAPLSVSSADSR